MKLENITKFLVLINFFFYGINCTAIAQWEQVNGPFGGAVVELTSNCSSIYARLAGQGVGCYMSSDSGSTWSSISGNLPENGFISPYQIGANDSAFFVIGSDPEERIVRTRDQGLTWENASYGLPGNFQQTDFCVTGKDLYLGTLTGVYHSANEGDSWTEANNGLESNWIKKFCSSDSVVYGITEVGEIFKTSDHGQLWEPVNLSWLTYQVYPVAFTVANNIFYAGTTSGIYSISEGITGWVQKNTGLTDTIVNALLTDGSMLYAGTSSQGVFQSQDGGNHWTQVSNGMIFKKVNSLTFLGDMIYSGNNCGTYRAEKSTMAWSITTEGMNHQAVLALAGHDSILYAGTTFGVYRSFDNGAHWELPVDLPELYLVHTLAFKEPYVFAGTSENEKGGFLRSSDNGQTWTLSNDGLGNINTRCFLIDDTALYLGTDSGIYLSLDDGLHWTLASPDFDVFSMSKKDSLFFLADYGYDGDCGFYRSTDNGDTWTILNNGIPSSQGPATIVIKDSMVYAGTINYSGGLYKMPILGDTWSVCTNGLPNCETKTLVVHDTTIFAGTYYAGIFLSKDEGNFWYGVSNGLPDDFIFHLWGMEDYLYLSLAQGYGLWRRPYDQMYVLNVQPDTLTLNWSLPSSDTLFIQATGHWTIQGTLQDWFNLDKFQGEGDDTVVCSALEENLSGSDNNATLTISSEYLGEIPLNFVQFAKPNSAGDHHRPIVVIYPNPASRSVKVKSESLISGITILNQNGFICKKVNVDKDYVEISLSVFNSGIYLLKIETISGIVTEKFILCHE
jgi:photosystem II stability/assembly factor-like uncharacterized protein